MANTIPCPNPACTHDFSLTEVQAASELLCPKCGFRMQGRAAAPKPAPAAKPKAKPEPPKPSLQKAPPEPPPLPLATPVATAVAADAAPAADDNSLSDGTFFNPDSNDGGALIRTNKAPKRSTWRSILVYTLAIGFAACIVIAAIGVVVWLYLGTGGLRALTQPEGDAILGKIRNSKNETETVFKLILPKGEKGRETWTYDSELLASFRDDEARDMLATAWRNDEYKEPFWFVLVAKDYGSLKPRDAEMMRLGVEKLDNLFGETVTLGDKVEPARFKDLPAQKLPFQGVLKEVRWNGECYMFFNNGIAYWLYVASPDNPVLVYFTDALPKNNVFVVTERRGWREQSAPRETFASVDGRIELAAPKGVWLPGDPKVDDASAHMLLTGRYQRQKDATKNAHLQIVALPKADNFESAIKAAREHREEKANNENYKLALAPEVVPGQKDGGTSEDVGNRRGRIIHLKQMFQAEVQRYYFVAVVIESDATYAVYCSCDWKSRQIWRQDFIDLLGQMKFK